jgi:hypothetical protein
MDDKPIEITPKEFKQVYNEFKGELDICQNHIDNTGFYLSNNKLYRQIFIGLNKTSNKVIYNVLGKYKKFVQNNLRD